MQILFVHQNFPSQYQYLVRKLALCGQHRLVALSMQSPQQSLPSNVELIRYGLRRGNDPKIHPLLFETESKVLRAEACAAAAHQLKGSGFMPDLICCHPGWGESLFLSEIWPESPLLCYQEFFYHTVGFDACFDPEIQKQPTWQGQARKTMKNYHLLQSLHQSTWNVTPTAFQRSTFPQVYQDRFSVIHDGIDTDQASPAPRPLTLNLPDGVVLSSGMPIVTFVNRTLEPYRGCHTFLRAIPELLQQVPDAHVVVVGSLQGVSYGAACHEGEWVNRFLSEIEGRYDPKALHFCGSLRYEHYLAILRLSACHVYLTYPFVLSWSLLEAMSCACPIVGSKTAPVEEVIEDGLNGVLVDFFSPSDLASAMADMLRHPQRYAAMRASARQTILDHYSLELCVPRHLALMEQIASGGLPAG